MSRPSESVWASPWSNDAGRGVVLGHEAPSWRAACGHLGRVLPPYPVSDDGALTCCLSAEGVSGAAQSRSPWGCSACICRAKAKSPRAFTLSSWSLQLCTISLHPPPSTKAVFTSTAPIWPSAINLCASNRSTLCDNSLR